MKNSYTKETITAVILVVLAVLIWNPFHFWMPTMLHMVMLGIALIIFGLFAGFVLREKAIDERATQHRMHAGRIAFLAGSTTLLLGILIQSFNHTTDIWLIAAFVVMIIAKIGTRIYCDYNN
jgi:hypothetical protein